MPSSPTPSSWSAPIRWRPRPTISSITGCRTCAAPARQEEGRVRRAEPVAPARDRLHRPPPHAHGRRLRGRGGQDNVLHLAVKSGHRPRAVQRAVHRDRRAGLGGSRLHRGEHRRDSRRTAVRAIPARRRSPSRHPAASTRRSAQPHHDRGSRRDHRPRRRRHPQGGRLDRRAEAGRRAAAHDVRLRKGPDLGQRQLPHQPGAGEHRARHRQSRPPRRRLRAARRASGRLCAPGLSGRPAGALHRSVADLRPGRRAPRLGLRPLQDDAERRRSSSAPTSGAPTW